MSDDIQRELGSISAKLASIEVHLANQLVQFEKIWDKFDSHDERIRTSSTRDDCSIHTLHLDKVWAALDKQGKLATEEIHKVSLRNAFISGGIGVLVFLSYFVPKLFKWSGD